MGQQSSAVVTFFRALIMLVCLIAIPLAALFGSSLPGMVKALQEGRIPFLKTASAAQKSPSDPPPFIPTSSASPKLALAIPAPAKESTPRSISAEAPSMAPQFPDPMASRGSSGVLPAAFETPMESATRPAAMTGGTPSAELTAAAFGKLSPISAERTNLVPVDTTAQDRPREPGDSLSHRDGSTSDPFNSVQSRLKQLGATYYLLESWGGQQQLYRFYCKMAVGGNANYTRYFEAIDSEPLRAMNQVLEQVETWRTSRM